MQTSGEIIAEAAKGHAEELATEYDVSLTRMYRILGEDNPYPKTVRLIRAIGRLNPEGLRQIQADFNARVSEILDAEDEKEISIGSFHRDLSHAVQMALELKPVAEKKSAFRRAIAVLTRELSKLK